MAGLTLSEFAKTEKDTLRDSVVDTLLMESDVMQLIPWETIGQLGTTTTRIQDLPSVGFRKINGTFSEGDGHLEQNYEAVFPMGGFSDADKLLVRAGNSIEDVRARQQMMTIKAMAFNFNDKFINGNPEGGDVDEFKGLKERIENTRVNFSGQYIDNGGTSGDGILLNSAERQNFIDKVDESMYGIAGHNPDCAFMNSTTLLAMRSTFRREGLLDTTKDQFDRVVNMYQSTALYDIGTTADQTTEILPNTETLEDAAAAESTSIYYVKFGVGEFFWGIQTYPLEVDDKGLLQTTPQYRTEIDWPLGMAQISPYSVVRHYAIIPNAST